VTAEEGSGGKKERVRDEGYRTRKIGGGEGKGRQKKGALP